MKFRTIAILAFLFLLLLAIASVAAFIMFTNTGMGIFSNAIDGARGDPTAPQKNEIVMPKNSRIEATTRTGTIIIRSGEGLRRYYSWEGITRSVVMGPRRERWHGSLGIYYPGAGYHWRPEHNGISRGVLEEGQQHFASVEEAMSWIDKMKVQYGYPLVYRNDGLLVVFGKTLSRKQLDVEVWQILIDGEKPNSIVGSDDEAIVTSWDD